MREIKFLNWKAKALLTGTFLVGIIFSGNVFASVPEFQLNTTEEYKVWKNLSTQEKSTTVMPRTFDVDVPDNILSNYEIENSNVPRVLNQLLGNAKNPFENVAAVTDERFNIADNLNLRVEHQGNTTQCWAFSLLKGVETNLALSQGVTEIDDFSERHMDYATSRTFLDGINPKGFQREVGRGGLLVVGLSYLTNGQGAVIEEDMPFENREEKINLAEIDKKVDTIVNDYTILPTIHKEYTRDSVGNTTSVKYYKSNGTEYTQEELRAVRNIIKEHLIENGAISTMTGGTISQFYSNSENIFLSEAYNCNDSSKIRDHAITIVGWDDNYSRDNFGNGQKPLTDGAYIILNTYGSESFDNGYMYISYEDFFIEQELYSIGSTGSVDYDNLYQHDYYGGIYQVGITSQSEGHYGVVYERDNTKDEILSSVGITLSDYSNVEIYINPNDNQLSKSKLIKVGQTNEVLSPGFHRINIRETQLTGDSFAIVVKQKSESGRFYFQIEANVPNTAYGLVDSEHNSFISIDGSTWTNISNLNVSGVDMSKSDICIKAFTTNGKLENNNEVNSDIYKINDEYIMNIEFNTSKYELLENLNINFEVNIISEEGNEIADDEIIKTGTKLILSDGTEYILIVRGDILPDGMVTLTDLSKLLLHYVEEPGYELMGNSLMAADMNIDGAVNLVDVSQMVVLYSSI